MRISLTPEQRALKESVRRLFTDTCATDTGRVDRDPSVTARVLAALADAGMLGLPYPEEVGGAGAGLFETGLLYFEGGRALCPSIVYTTMLSGIAIHELADDECAARWLPSLATGATATAALWSAEDTHSVRPAVRARRTHGRLTLTGAVDFVENAAAAEQLVVLANDSDSGRWVLAISATDGPGVRHRPVAILGRDPVGHITLHEQPAAELAVLGPGALTRLAEIALALQCMEMVGGTERVIEDTVDYVGRREQFGRPIGSFQAVQHIVADLRIALDGARLAAWRALWQVAAGRPAAREVAIAKLHASEAYKTATLQCHQLMGGMGFLRESDLHLWSERAKVSEIRNGSPDVALGWLATAIDVR
jgi:alkylation response protein AidB-like acyl-CoA dehydrogenase